MTTRLNRPPTFVTVRQGAGAAAADNATVNDANYPPATIGFIPGTPNAHEIIIYWTATGVLAGLTFDLQILIRDGVNSRWTLGPTVTGVPATELVRFHVHGATLVAIRVVAVAAAGATNFVICAAESPE